MIDAKDVHAETEAQTLAGFKPSTVVSGSGGRWARTRRRNSS
jgi:hypothetical protein